MRIYNLYIYTYDQYMHAPPGLLSLLKGAFHMYYVCTRLLSLCCPGLFLMRTCIYRMAY